MNFNPRKKKPNKNYLNQNKSNQCYDNTENIANRMNDNDCNYENKEIKNEIHKAEIDLKNKNVDNKIYRSYYLFFVCYFIRQKPEDQTILKRKSNINLINNPL